MAVFCTKDKKENYLHCTAPVAEKEKLNVNFVNELSLYLLIEFIHSRNQTVASRIHIKGVAPLESSSFVHPLRTKNSYRHTVCCLLYIIQFCEIYIQKFPFDNIY